MPYELKRAKSQACRLNASTTAAAAAAAALTALAARGRIMDESSETSGNEVERLMWVLLSGLWEHRRLASLST